MDFRLVAYDRLGPRRGVLPNPLEMNVNKTWNGLTTLDLHYDVQSPNVQFLEDEPEVAIERFDGTQWVEIRDGRLRCLTVDLDHLEEVPTRRYQFIGIGEGLKGALVYQAYGLPLNDEGKVQFKVTNAGRLISTVWDNAVSRGWTGFSKSFTSTTDSAGNPWTQTFTISYSYDTSLLSIVNSMIAQGLIDISWTGRTMNLYRKEVISTQLSTDTHPRAAVEAKVTVGTTRIDLPVDVRYSAFPIQTKLNDGRILMVWYEATDHADARDGIIVGSYSPDNGQTWGAKKTFVSIPGIDARDPTVSTTNDGSILFLTYTKPTAAKPRDGFYLKRSTDNGNTWGPEIRIDPAGYKGVGTAPIVELPNGNLMAVYYGLGTNETLDSVWRCISTDKGLTWGSHVKFANGHIDGRAYQEPYVAVRGNNVVIMYRHGNEDQIGITRSTDAGATWSTPGPTFIGTGRAACLLTSKGTLIVVYRDLGGKNWLLQHAVMRYSYDLGATWADPQMVEPTDPRWSLYSCPTEIAPGTILVSTAVEHSNTFADISLRYLFDGSAIPAYSDPATSKRMAGSGSMGTDAAPELIDMSSLATHIIILGEGNLRWEFPTGASVAEGRREEIQSYSGVDDIATASVLAAPLILKAQNHLKNTTRQWHLSQKTTLLPFEDYEVGNWIDVQRGVGFENLQIVDLNVQVNQNGVQGYVTLGDKIDDLLSTMYARIQGLTGGIANEGGKPPTPSTRIPATPTDVNVTVDAHIDELGKTYGSISVNWAHSFKDQSNEAIEISRFEVLYRPIGTASWNLLFSTTDQSGTGSPVAVYSAKGQPMTYLVAVRAISSQDRISALSTPPVSVTMVDDTTPPPKPTDPIAMTWLRTVSVQWDGQGLSGSDLAMAMPPDFDYIKVWQADNALMTDKVEVGRMKSATTISLGSKPADVTLWYAFTAVDYAGNESVLSDIVSVTPVTNVDASEIIDFIDASNITLTNVGSDALTDEAVTADKLAHDAVDLTKLADEVHLEFQNNAQAAADAAQAAADAAQAAADADQRAADASQAAADAMTEAGLKGAIHWVPEPPATAGVDYTNDMWVDTNDGYKPYRWNTATSEWVESQDVRAVQAALDADAAATAAVQAAANAANAQTAATNAQNAAAQSAADAAQAAQNAANAQAAAQDAANAAQASATAASLAQTTANGKITISTAAPTNADGTGKPVPALWQQKTAGKIVGNWEWNGSTWTSLPFSETFLPAVNIGTGTYGELDGLRIKAKSIGTTQLIVSDLNSYVENGNFELPVIAGVIPGWTKTGNWALNTTTPPEGVNTLVTTYNAATQSMLNGYPLYLKVGDKVRVRMFVKADAVTAGSQLRVALQNVVGSALESTINPPFTTVWTEYDFILTATTTGWKKLYFDTTGTGTGTVGVDHVRMWKMDAGEMIVDGTLKAIKLDTNEIWSDTAWIGKANINTLSLLSNTDGTGAKSTITGQGLKVVWVDPSTLEEQPRVQIGTFGDDYVSLRGDDGKPTVSLDKDGGIAGRDIYANDSFYYRNTELTQVLDELPKGVVGRAYRATDSVIVNAGPVAPYLRLEVDLPPRRMYKVCTTPIHTVNGTAAATIRLNIQYKSNGQLANTASNVLCWDYASNAHDTATARHGVSFERLFFNDQEVTQTWSFLLSYSGVGGTAKIVSDADRPVFLWVEDAGPYVPSEGVYLNAATSAGGDDPAPAAPIKKYTTEWAYNAVKSYQGNNTRYLFNLTKAYQGLSPAGYGILKSFYAFPSLTGTIGSATIEDIWVYLYFEHWYNNAGGTARIYLHGHSTLPDSSWLTADPNGNGPLWIMDSAKWPRAAGRWVRVPTTYYNGFKTGLYRGFGLGGDSTYASYGIANNARIRIRYSK